MAFSFRKAVRENVHVLVGLAGGTGSGKTLSALRLARGLVGPAGQFAVVDTEEGRALHYAGETPPGGVKVEFEHGHLRAPFTPAAYLESIEAAAKSGFGCLVIDSASHEWEGVGGILEMQEAELTRMAGDDYGRREACKMASWVRPKGEHRKMVARLLQLRMHIVFCFRAAEKVEMVKSGNKMEVRPKRTLTGLDGWVPICEKNLPFEMTASFLVTADNPGVPKPIKLQEQHKPMFPLDVPINELSGELLAAWAAGGQAAPAPTPAAKMVGRGERLVSFLEVEENKSAGGKVYWSFTVQDHVSECQVTYGTTSEPVMRAAMPHVGTGDHVVARLNYKPKGIELLGVVEAQEP